MSTDSAIEWTNSTWNPVTGCTKISPGCKNCYAERMAARLKEMGVSIENRDYLSRVNDLRKTRAKIKFLSIEPLLGPIPNLDLSDIDWVIVGGESGPGSRPMKEEWVLEILEQCQESRVPFFFKQWGGVQKKKTGRLLLGRTWDEMPVNV